MPETQLTFAVPKGRILDEALPVMARAGVVPEQAFHDKANREIKDWFYPAFARKLYGHVSEEKVEQFVKFLDSPARVVMEFIPTKKIVYDGDKMARATPIVKGVVAR